MPRRRMLIAPFLTAKPADVAALLGLERVLRSDRPERGDPPGGAGRARGRSTGRCRVRRRAARVGRGVPAGQRARGRRDGGLAPCRGTKRPYREWGAAALHESRPGDRAEAYKLGRARLGRPDALAAEMAQLAITEGNYAVALREWLPAVRRLPGYRVTAVATLAGCTGRHSAVAPADARAGLRSHRPATRGRAAGPLGRSARRAGGARIGPARLRVRWRSTRSAAFWTSFAAAGAGSRCWRKAAPSRRSRPGPRSRRRRGSGWRRHRPIRPRASWMPPAGCWPGWREQPGGQGPLVVRSGHDAGRGPHQRGQAG